MGAPNERLRRSEAEATYVRAGEIEVFRQLQRDAVDVDASLREQRAIAVGPFGRVRADAVVDALGKTRGAINNLWGSQEAFRAAIMQLFLDDAALGLGEVEYPTPAACRDLDDWIDRWAEVEIARGPQHEMAPESRYGMRWAAWLGLVPYGIWSESIATASMHEFGTGVRHVANAVLEPAFDHFGVVLQDVGIEDLALAATTLIEGSWLNAALTSTDPIGRDGTIASSLAASLRLLVRGAIAH